jgi:predicted enzyme related to lactoylglutathione lyase
VVDHIICHFEIPADDVETLAGFYKELFGWEVAPAPGFNDYWFVRTSADPNAVAGGMMSRQHPMQGIMNYVLVEDVAGYTERAQSMGAKLLVPKTEIPGMGWFAVITDPQNNCLGLFEVLEQG